MRKFMSCLENILNFQRFIFVEWTNPWPKGVKESIVSNTLPDVRTHGFADNASWRVRVGFGKMCRKAELIETTHGRSAFCSQTKNPVSAFPDVLFVTKNSKKWLFEKEVVSFRAKISGNSEIPLQELCATKTSHGRTRTTDTVSLTKEKH